jgi:hypothetical protein
MTNNNTTLVTITKELDTTCGGAAAPATPGDIGRQIGGIVDTFVPGGFGVRLGGQIGDLVGMFPPPRPAQ